MVRTRFAPSPTGFLHIGSLRTAVYAYALAKHNQGEFLLRIEDTDQKREVAGAAEKIQSILKLFGLNWDSDVVFQSHRAEAGVYRQAALKLIESGHAYYSQSEAKNAKKDGYSSQLRDPDREKGLSSGAVKLRVPDNQTIKFHDFILKKDITWDSNKVPDVVLLKSDGTFPTYHLAQAVDDHEYGISHVIRSTEWLTSTPLHVLIHQYLGYDLPQIGHPTAILDPQGGKLSKRKGNVSCEQFIEAGYLPEALLNFIILLGWAPKNNQELYTLAEFVENFDPNGFQVSNPTLNLEKLNWFNGQYIRKLSDSQLSDKMKPFVKKEDTKFSQILPLIKDRLVTLNDYQKLSTFFFHPPHLDTSLISDINGSINHLQLAINISQKLATWNKEDIDTNLVSAVKASGYKVGDFFMTLRICICGSKFTPPLSDVMVVIGRESTLSRLNTALEMLKNQTQTLVN